MPKTENKLEPCPFCSGDAGAFYGFDNKRRRLFFIQCHCCGASSDFTRAAATASTLWNKRTERNPLLGLGASNSLLALGHKIRGNKLYTVSWNDADYYGRRRHTEIVAKSNANALEQVKADTPAGSDFKVVSVESV